MEFDISVELHRPSSGTEVPDDGRWSSTDDTRGAYSGGACKRKEHEDTYSGGSFYPSFVRHMA